MERRITLARPDWRRQVEAQGLVFHTAEGVPYWNETAYYVFTAREVDQIEAATNELHARCLEAVQHVIDRRRYAELGIPEHAVPLIEASWEEEPPSVYGRFDLAYDGTRPPVLLEYNADTPTSLLEAAVVQWFWLQATRPEYDQFNSLHERLIATWQEMIPYLNGPVLHFTALDTAEDAMTLSYLQDCAAQAGITTCALALPDVGYDASAQRFVDLEGAPITHAFKLYPWEWLIHEDFGQHLPATSATTKWIEPAWKMVLSNKGILAILWELFPGHPNLAPAFLGHPGTLRSYARKPLLSREGANITLVRERMVVTAGDDQGYGEEGYVYQALQSMRTFSGKTPVIGSWIIGQEAGGMGIRETDGLITGNTSQFIPHVFR